MLRGAGPEFHSLPFNCRHSIICSPQMGRRLRSPIVTGGMGVAAIDGRRERESILGFVRALAVAGRRIGADMRAVGLLLLHGGLWPRVTVAAAIALVLVLTGEFRPSQRPHPPALPPEPLLATPKVDRLDAYARETAAADALAAPAADSGALDWSSASRRIATHTITGANGERIYAIRVSVPEGTPVRAAANGIVEFAGDAADGLGAKVVLGHGAVKTVYAHASDLRVKARQRVRKGQVIARSGQSGFAPSPRLYLALVSADPGVNPVGFFAGAVAGKAERCADAACDERVAPAKGGAIPVEPSRPAPLADFPARLSR
jgi:murein DD-endopeptidase MepM/ murein hydrolase activator NlpD